MKRLLIAGLLLAAPLAEGSLKLCVVQLDIEPTLEGNERKIVRFVEQAAGEGCRAVVFPEGALRNPVESIRNGIAACIRPDCNVYLQTLPADLTEPLVRMGFPPELLRPVVEAARGHAP